MPLVGIRSLRLSDSFVNLSGGSIALVPAVEVGVAARRT
jgi:hypothetical protein